MKTYPSLVATTLSTVGTAATALGLALSSVSASALVIGDSNPHSFWWSFTGGAHTLMGDGSLQVTGFNSSSLTVLVELHNKTVTTDTAGKDARLVAFGFGIDPNATSVTFNDLPDGGMLNASLSSIPSLASIEVCAFGGPNCSGGGNGGIFGDGTATSFHRDVFSLILAGTWGSSVTIDPVGFKYQTPGGSYEFTTRNWATNTTGQLLPNEIPEPSSTALVLLGLALAGANFNSRRKI